MQLQTALPFTENSHLMLLMISSLLGRPDWPEVHLRHQIYRNQTCRTCHRSLRLWHWLRTTLHFEVQRHCIHFASQLRHTLRWGTFGSHKNHPKGNLFLPMAGWHDYLYLCSSQGFQNLMKKKKTTTTITLTMT